MAEILAGDPVARFGRVPGRLRLSADDEIDGGIDPVEAAAIARLLEADRGLHGRLALVVLAVPQAAVDPRRSAGVRDRRPAQVVTTAVEIPTIVTGRIMTLDHASHLVSAGVADMVSMVRALIADPELIVKSRDGRDSRDPAVHRHVAWDASPS